MQTYIYKSSRKEELYLYITNKDDFSQIPQSLFDSMGKEPIFVMELSLSSDRALAREDVDKVINNLSTQGYHVQMPPMTHNISSFNEKLKYVN